MHHRYQVPKTSVNVCYLGLTPSTALSGPKNLRQCLLFGTDPVDQCLLFGTDPVDQLGMKNWMFFGSLEAGANNALIYTLLANCRAQGLDPEAYLVEVIKRLPPAATPEQAAALTPARIAAERRPAAEEAA
jgi:hypothetical protein